MGVVVMLSADLDGFINVESMFFACVSIRFDEHIAKDKSDQDIRWLSIFMSRAVVSYALETCHCASSCWGSGRDVKLLHGCLLVPSTCFPDMLISCPAEHLHGQEQVVL